MTIADVRARLSWAKLIHRVDEVDPLLCPFCGAEIEIFAFIVDSATASVEALGDLEWSVQSLVTGRERLVTEPRL